MSVMTWLIDNVPAALLPYVYMLTEQQWLMVANAAALLLIVAGLFGSIYCALRALGWRRFRGHWYSPQQFHALVQELYSGVKDGRVPDYQTMRLLDQYVYGPRGSDLRKLTQRDAI